MPHLLPGLLDTSLKFILDAGPAAAAASWEDVGRAPSGLCLLAPAAVVLGMPRMLMGLRYSWWPSPCFWFPGGHLYSALLDSFS